MGARCKEQQRQQVAELTREEKWQLAFDRLPDQEKVDTLLLFGKEKIVPVAGGPGGVDGVR